MSLNYLLLSTDNLHVINCHCLAEIAQLTSYDSGIAETPETDESVSVSSFK